MSELHLYDTELEAARDKYAETAAKIEEQLNSTLADVKAIHQNGSMQGQAADKLLAFAELAEETICGELDDIFVRYKAITNQFTQDVTEQDDAEL